MMEMKDFFLLTETVENDYALLEWKKNGIPCEIIFKKVSKPLRAVRRLWVWAGIPFEHIWYRKWKKRAESAKCVIIHMSYLTFNICQYINKINPDAKVIAWYWNPIDASYLPHKVKGKCEKFSFDPNDCSKYGLSFNHQYYFKSFVSTNENAEIDVCYVGSDKGRGSKILEFYNFFIDKKYKVLFKVVNACTSGLPDELKSEFVNYEDVRKIISKSNVILEILQETQSGPTLRAMEAIFFEKKLITNNSNIKKEPFYDRDNIFVFPERSLEELDEFMHVPYKKFENDYVELYDVKQWIYNFVEENRND